MARRWLKLEYLLTTTAPLARYGDRFEAGGDASTLAGWSIKGAARRSAGSVALALGLPACVADGSPACPICRLFGSPGVEGALHWDDASRDEGASRQADALELSRRRAIDRALGISAAPEAGGCPALPAGLRFRGRVQGWLGADAEADAGFVVASLQHVERLGGGKTSGHGAVALTVTLADLAGERPDPAALLDAALAREVW